MAPSLRDRAIVVLFALFICADGFLSPAQAPIHVAQRGSRVVCPSFQPHSSPTCAPKHSHRRYVTKRTTSLGMFFDQIFAPQLQPQITSPEPPKGIRGLVDDVYLITTSQKSSEYTGRLARTIEELRLAGLGPDDVKIRYFVPDDEDRVRPRGSSVALGGRDRAARGASSQALLDR